MTGTKSRSWLRIVVLGGMLAMVGPELAPSWLRMVPHAAAQPSGIVWLTGLEQARQVATAQRRLILVHFWNDGCPPCAAVERNVFSRPEVERVLSAGFVPVKIKFDDAPEVAKWFGIDRYPMDLVLTADGKELLRTVSPPDSPRYVAMLEQVAAAARPAIAAAAVANAQKAPSSAAALVGAAVGTLGGEFAPSAASHGTTMWHQGVDPPAPLAVSRATSQAGPYQEIAASRANAATSRPIAANTASFVPVAANRRDPEPASATNSVPSPLAIDGFCPVNLMEQGKWKRGDARWGAIHRDRTYLFSGPTEQQMFLANPDRFAPMLSGFDPVIFAQHGQLVPGRRECGVWFQSHMYLFADDASLERFRSSPASFAGRTEQAMRLPQ